MFHAALIAAGSGRDVSTISILITLAVCFPCGLVMISHINASGEDADAARTDSRAIPPERAGSIQHKNRYRRHDGHGNWGPGSLQPPYNGSSESDGGHKVFDFAVEPCCNVSPVLEATKHVFDDVALFINGFFVVVLELPVFARRDHHRCCVFLQPFPRFLAVIALVSDEFPGRRHGFETRPGGPTIVDVSRPQE